MTAPARNRFGNRVVVTGVGAITSLGHDWSTIESNLRRGISGVTRIDDWDKYVELNTRLAAPVRDFVDPPHFTRKVVRSMGRVSKLATRASEVALEDAGLRDNSEIQNGSMGVAYGSCTGSTDAIREFTSMLVDYSMTGINATTYIRMMPHTAAANVGVYLGLKGRIIPTCSACTSGSQAVGYAYEAIRFGRQTSMLAGGAEELCVTEAAVFDNLYAASTRNDTPTTTPAPFDKHRDGLVIGEGACTLVLEDLAYAQARGAKIYAEIVGFASNSDGDHLTHPNTNTMQVAMERALADADLPPSAIGYVSAHATATEQGDIAESQAMHRLFGPRIPVSSMKGNYGHTLGACGALESWLAIQMMNHDWYAPTLNLKQVDERCGELDYLMGEGRRMQNEYVMNNNFAFAGINTSLVFRRWS